MFLGRSSSRLTSILTTVALMVSASAALAQELPGSRFPISKANVVEKLGAVGVNVEASQVHIPVGMSAASISPKLEILRAKAVENDQVRLQLRCSTVTECLPFFATLDIKEANLVSSEIQTKTSSTTVADRQKELQAGVTLTNQPQIKVGSHAVLIIRDGHVDIHLQVLAIDTGVLGQQVRVSTLDRKKIFRATVTGEGTVTGVIE